MFVQVWKMRARKKRAEDYERFGQQVTLPTMKKIDGCIAAYFVRVVEARKPEYLWVVFWRDLEALEAARSNPAWREQMKKFEEGRFYKTIPLELVCEDLASFTAFGSEKPKKAGMRKRTNTKRNSGRSFAASTAPGV